MTKKTYILIGILVVIIIVAIVYISQSQKPEIIPTVDENSIDLNSVVPDDLVVPTPPIAEDPNSIAPTDVVPTPPIENPAPTDVVPTPPIENPVTNIIPTPSENE
ncbi:MAG: hypothetical protein ABH808_03545 [Candidatus Kuenenbacteria bacterium]